MSLKLHLGCGQIHLDGWQNIDVRPTAAADRVLDIAALQPEMFREPITDIYACHVLEHFGFGVAEPSAQSVLASWARLLEPGGRLFISVPDLRAVGAALARGSNLWEDWNWTKCLYGGCEYPTNRHFIGFTELTLRMFFTNAGLIDVTKFESFARDTSAFVLHETFVSLNLRGVRP